MIVLSLGSAFLFALAQATTATEPAAMAGPPTQVAPLAKPGDLPTPTDATERMELGRKMNGLQGLDPRPWHLKASYEVFDSEGKSKDKGTFEEWRIHPRQYKLAFHSAGLSLEEYGTDHGVYRTGRQDWPGVPVGMIEQEIVRPIPLEASRDKTVLKNYERSFGAVKLQCTMLIRGEKKAAENSSSYCFAPTNGVLLYSSSPRTVFQSLFEHVSLVGERYVARDIQVFLVGRPWLSVHIDAVESLAPSAFPDLAVPASALPVSRRADGSGVVTAGSLVRKAVPQYPVTAKMQGAQGTVILSAYVGSDGHIKRLDVLAGPPLLQQAAMDAVRQWVYSPFLMDGEPVEDEIQVNVEFRLGG